MSQIKFVRSTHLPEKMEAPEGMREFYDRKLLELATQDLPFRTEARRKRTIKEKAKEWFLERFADLYEKVRGDYLDE